MCQSKNKTKSFVLLIFPGPSYRLKDSFSFRLNGLSQEFQGAIVTSKPRPAVERIARFPIIAVRRNKSSILIAINYFFACRRIAKTARAKKYGIHLVVSYDPLRSGLIGCVFSRLVRAKFISEVNGDYADIANYQDAGNRFTRRLKRFISVSLQQFVLRRTNGIKLLYKSQLASTSIELTKHIVDVFPNLIRLARFHNIMETPTVLVVGFPIHVKGIDLLIDAFKLVAGEFPDWQLKILGHYRRQEYLNSLIDGHDRIFVHSAVHHAEMPEHLGSCGIFVLPSRTESMGRVLIEAMASAKPRIGTRVGGIPTVIHDGVDGILVEPGDPIAISKALRTLMSNPELRQSMGEAGARRAREQFSETKYFQNTIDFYRKVIAL